MIEQQYYTRERRGIFSKNPGYDTIAKTENLHREFIINIVQDLCFYHAPTSLAGEEDLSKYPVAFFCVNTEHNKMIIGQSAFAGKDYTGTRNRYFTHNYIVSEEERNKYIEKSEKMIYASGFVKNYDIDKGSVITEILEIPQTKEDDIFSSMEEMFLATGINREIFINLIKACFDSVNFGKKIYVVLDSEYADITVIAKGILKYLYRAIPFDIRRKIGFITYMKEPKIKNLIDIIFLCKGSIKRLTTEIKAGYLFDLPEKNFYLDGMDEEKHIFIDFVMDNIENKELLNKFFCKADKANNEDKILSENILSIYYYDNILKLKEEKGKGNENGNYSKRQRKENKLKLEIEENFIKSESLEESKDSIESKEENFDTKKRFSKFFKKVIRFLKQLKKGS
jgi:hypothetical protein